ncbi:DUF5671 domain-containing protein [Parafrigoribacterium soli]|uniref:DUF5671 domain-containing protein n=1 Tax=Parafrigoribacterium soli TaxID=3144663 RepID=UPI0032EDC199
MGIAVVVAVALLIVGGIVAVVMATRAAPSAGETAAAPTVRRLIVLVLLFALVVIGAIGIAGLLGRLLNVGAELVAGDTAGLAGSLAFALIGGPLAGLVWWLVWRRAGMPAERHSVAWGLYVAGMSVVSLVTFASSLLSAASNLVGGSWHPQSFATGLVWAGVWAWHRWMAKHPERGPLALAAVAPILSAAYGLILGTGGAVTALGGLLDAAIGRLATDGSIGHPWWRSVLEAVVWAVGGALVWWWHWVRGGVRHNQDRLAHVAVAVFGILGGAILTIAGAVATLHVLLRLAFDPGEPAARILAPMGVAIAAAALGSLVWAYHDRVASEHSSGLARTVRLVASGVALVAAASGVGVIVNSLLATFGEPLAGSGARTLLLGGISSLVVGGPLWWLAWRPNRPAAPAEDSTGRRIYLITVFGLSAVSALITLLVLGFRLFEFALADNLGGALVDRVRAPLGLFVATALVAAYHFSVWRHDRAAQAETPSRKRTIERVILVATADAETQKRAVEECTGAAVTLWLREDAAVETRASLPEGTAMTNASADPSADSAVPSWELLAAALKGVSGKRVLVVTGPGAAVQVIPLKD